MDSHTKEELKKSRQKLFEKEIRTVENCGFVSIEYFLFVAACCLFDFLVFIFGETLFDSLMIVW
jgi:hypothetical protein